MLVSRVAHVWRYMCDVTCNRFGGLDSSVENSGQILILGQHDWYSASDMDELRMPIIAIATSYILSPIVTDCTSLPRVWHVTQPS